MLNFGKFRWFLVALMAGIANAANPGVATVPSHAPVTETAMPPEPTSASGEALLARVQESSSAVYDSLLAFVCSEHIERFRSALDGTHERPIDSVHAALSFENGTEQYTSIWQNGQPRSDIPSLSGAWSEGEFGSLLKQTQELLQVEHVVFLGREVLDGDPVAAYAFDTAADNSPWELAVDAHVYRLAFHSEVYVSLTTEHIVRIARAAVGIPPQIGISKIDWSVSLKPVALNGSEWWLPSSATYSVSYATRNRREWNRILFDGYRRYGSTAELRFDNPR